VAWLSLALVLPQAEAERLSEALLEAGAESVALESEALESGSAQVRLSALAPRGGDPAALLRDAAAIAGLEAPAFELSAVEDEDWVRRSQAQFRPIHIGGRLWIVPSWHEPPAGDVLVVRLDPGLAFGTGSHATTRLVLQFLESNLRTASRVLDYGCGSGILAIAAAKLGAAHVAATDIDPQALITTAENAAHNGVALEIAAPEALPAGAYDLVLANILAAPLVSLAALLAAQTRRGGRIVLSGILESQADEVIGAYAGDFDIAVGARADGWVRLDGRRT
jgi:ribosomal protein L11 methyltransferase